MRRVVVLNVVGIQGLVCKDLGKIQEELENERRIEAIHSIVKIV